MAMIRSVRVGPLTYQVRQDGPSVAKLDERDAGMCSEDDLLIVVNPARPLDIQRETLLHEVLHTVTYMTGLRSEFGEKREERFVNRVTPVLLDVLRRNPRLVEYLTG